MRCGYNTAYIPLIRYEWSYASMRVRNFVTNFVPNAAQLRRVDWTHPPVRGYGVRVPVAAPGAAGRQCGSARETRG